MLKLIDVTIKHERQLILHGCNYNFTSQSIIVANNNINTDILARTLAGFSPVNEGEIRLVDNFLSNKEKHSRKVFFVIREDYGKWWRNYRLYEIPKIMKAKYQGSILYEKYNIEPQSSYDSLTKFQQLIYLISLGQLLNRTIFVFDQPTKYFDYNDLENFSKFLNDDFVDTNYIIFTNRIEGIFTELAVPMYQIDTAKLLALKGGERNVGKQKNKVEI